MFLTYRWKSKGNFTLWGESWLVRSNKRQQSEPWGTSTKTEAEMKPQLALLLLVFYETYILLAWLSVTNWPCLHSVQFWEIRLYVFISGRYAHRKKWVTWPRPNETLGIKMSCSDAFRVKVFHYTDKLIHIWASDSLFSVCDILHWVAMKHACFAAVLHGHFMVLFFTRLKYAFYLKWHHVYLQVG